MANNISIVDVFGNNRVIDALDVGTVTGGASELLAERIAHSAPAAVTATLSALNAALVCPVDGMGNVLIQTVAGTNTITLAYEYSWDGGNTWGALQGSRVDTFSAVSSLAIAGGALGLTFALDGGMTHVRARVSSYTSGSVTVLILPSTTTQDPSPTVGLAAANARVGFVGGAGIWQDATSTALAANAVFTGASRDLANNATNVAWATTSSYAAEYRLSAEADVAGTLYLEVSRDNTTFRRIKGVALTQFDTSSVFYGEIIHKPSTRYGRLVFVNGAAAQTQFMAQEMYLSLV